ELGLPALIPEEYMPDVHMRLVHYKRIASARSDAELDELQVELIDRFGLLPPALKTLFAVTRLKLAAREVGVEKISAGAEGGTLRFGRRATVDPHRLISLVEKEPHRFKLDGPFKLKCFWRAASEQDRIGIVEKVLERLGAARPASAAA